MQLQKIITFNKFYIYCSKNSQIFLCSEPLHSVEKGYVTSPRTPTPIDTCGVEDTCDVTSISILFAPVTYKKSAPMQLCLLQSATSILVPHQLHVTAILKENYLYL